LQDRNIPYYQGQILNDRYEVFGADRGGMGLVLFCKDHKGEVIDNVALKTLFDDFLSDEHIRKRFENEAASWLKIGDVDSSIIPLYDKMQFTNELKAWLTMGGYARSNILPLYEVTNINGKPFLVMMYCKNGNLKYKIQNCNLSEKEKIRIATHIIMGMHWYSDKYGFVHRDLKPENILFDDDNNPRITDFGIVKLSSESQKPSVNNINNDSLTQYRSFLGTLLYASPEQLLDSKNVDSQTDIWAFGIILYELILGNPPFVGTNNESLINSISYQSPPNLNIIRKKINLETANIIRTCLEKDKNNRYRTVKQLLEAWNNVINIFESPKKRSFFFSDKRIILQDESIEFRWPICLPDKFSNDRLKLVAMIDFSPIVGCKEAYGFYNAGNMLETLISCDKVLGNLNDPNSFVNALFAGTLPEDPYITDPQETTTGLKSTSIPNRKLVHRTLILKLRVLSEIISANFPYKDAKQIIIEYSKAILKSKYQPSDLMIYAAQGFCDNCDFAAAEKIIWKLIYKNDNNQFAWATLLIILDKERDVVRRNEIAHRIIEHNSKQRNEFSLILCASSYEKLGNWEQSYQYAKQAFDLNPGNINIVYQICASLINLRRFKEAKHFLEIMRKINPLAIEVKQIEDAFNLIDKS
jgi:serine/threonine protein kinase